MKYLSLVLITIALATSCKKKENVIPEPPKVPVQTEYRLMKVRGDSATYTSYAYNDNNLVKAITHYYYVLQFHYTVPAVNYSYDYYEYDSQWRITKSSSTPTVQANEYSTYTYNDDLKPVARYHSKYSTPMEEYVYNGNRLAERKTYDIYGAIVSTEQWTYNSAGNPETKVIQYYPKPSPNVATDKFIIKYLQYDNARAIRYAMPGIQDIQFGNDMSENNVLKSEYTMYMTDGKTSSELLEYSYEYNSGNFPVKAMVKTTINGTTTVYAPVYYEYNK